MIKPTTSTSSTTPSDTSERSMPNMVTRRRWKGQPADRLRVHPAFVRAEVDVSVLTLAAHHGSYIARIAATVEAAAAIPDVEFIDRALKPIDAARASIKAPELTPELIERCSVSDSGEEVTEARFLAGMTVPKARQWIAKARQERADKLLLDLALERWIQEQESPNA